MNDLQAMVVLDRFLALQSQLPEERVNRIYAKRDIHGVINGVPVTSIPMDDYSEIAGRWLENSQRMRDMPFDGSDVKGSTDKAIKSLDDMEKVLLLQAIDAHYDELAVAYADAKKYSQDGFDDMVYFGIARSYLDIKREGNSRGGGAHRNRNMVGFSINQYTAQRETEEMRESSEFGEFGEGDEDYRAPYHKDLLQRVVDKYGYRGYIDAVRDEDTDAMDTLKERFAGSIEYQRTDHDYGDADYHLDFEVVGASVLPDESEEN